MSLETQDWAPSQIPGLGKLSNSKGVKYADFRNSLTTNYFSSRVSVYVNWLCVTAILLFVNHFSHLLLPGIALLSLLQHRLLLVIHEGAHFLFAKNRRINDLFTNLTSGWFVLSSVESYRIIHIKHHRSLGSEEDPEATHMDLLDLTWILSALVGLKTLRTVFRRKRNSGGELRHKQAGIPMLSKLTPMIGVILHATVVAALAMWASTTTLVVWIVATYIIAPFLGLLRNLLEHRYVDAVDPMIWSILLEKDVAMEDSYRTNVTTRTFTQSTLSRLYGSMGFTRHLLHHWDPSISFQNLDLVHDFLLDSKLGELLRKTDSTYTRMFIKLWNK